MRWPPSPAACERRSLHQRLAALLNGDTDAATHEAEAALSIDATYAPALAIRARALARNGHTREAESAIMRYLASRPPPDSRESAEALADLALHGVKVRRPSGQGQPSER
jgi:uncharacterized membrane-anchored protein